MQTGNIAIKAIEIEHELKALNRWQQKSLPVERFTDMGAFGSNTMSFEQWIQFVLLPRIHQIIVEKDQFPDESSLSAYAVRYFDGDMESDHLQELLRGLDDLINQKDVPQDAVHAPAPQKQPDPDSVSLGDVRVPEPLIVLADVLHLYKADDINSQLETFDIFLNILSPTTRPAIAELLRKASVKCENLVVKTRLEKASSDVAAGKSAAQG
jgi:uncharacterized protein YqcC (DUF446 family)